MRVERWFSQNRVYEILRSRERGVLLENQERFSLQQKQELLQRKGRPIEQVRKEMVKSAVEKSVIVPPLKLERHFQENGDFENAEKVRKTDLQQLTTNARSLFHETALIGESFIEGFLGFYGIELNKAVERYERRIQAYEEWDLVTGEKRVFVAQLDKGHVQRLSPAIGSLEEAQQYQKSIEEREMKQSNSLSLQQKIEEEG